MLIAIARIVEILTCSITEGLVGDNASAIVDEGASACTRQLTFWATAVRRSLADL